MRVCVCAFVAAPAVLLFRGVASAQHPILDRIANKSFRNTSNRAASSCGKSTANRHRSRNRELSKFYGNNFDMRAAFINQVTPPIANKMFECGPIDRIWLQGGLGAPKPFRYLC